MSILKTILDRQRVIVPLNARVMVICKGRIHALLGPGEHMIPRKDTELTRFDIANSRIMSPLVDALMRDAPEMAGDEITEVRTGADEVAIVVRDARAHDVVTPDTRALFWTEAGPWTVERVSIGSDHGVDPALAQRLMRSALTRTLAAHEVPEGKVGLLFTDGVQTRLLTSGTHWFWTLGRKHLVKLVDTRWQTKEVTGQEILTKDRVTLRVNISADFRVIDPVLAVTAVRDHEEALHRALQLAFRKTLGALTLDRLLAEKVTVDAEAADVVRRDMAKIGLELGDIALKDVILPGEMREILNQVVAVQKEAEANVIRRREETNATRSLLNTAKVMSENPVMLRLKELEALETIAGKVDQLTVHNGTEGLMSDLVRLRD